MEDGEKTPLKVTDIESLKQNIEDSVQAFTQRYICVPSFSLACTPMDQRQLRDAMGLRATIDAGDPWPAAERLLLDMGFRWQFLGGCRVMFLQERDDMVPDDGWEDAEEV